MMQDLKYNKALAGERVYYWRNALHLTQEQLAEKIDMSARTITDIERGVVGMSMETLFALCQVFGVTPNDLLLSDKPVILNELDWLSQTLSALPEHDRNTAVELVKTYLRSL